MKITAHQGRKNAPARTSMSLYDDVLEYEQIIGVHCRSWTGEQWVAFWHWRELEAIKATYTKK